LSVRHCSAEFIGDAELILTNKTPISAETMQACRNLRYIGVLATGEWTQSPDFCYWHYPLIVGFGRIGR